MWRLRRGLKAINIYYYYFFFFLCFVLFWFISVLFLGFFVWFVLRIVCMYPSV